MFYPLGLQINPRDIEVLRGLFESRVMLQKHATELYFEGRVEAAKKRLQKLKGAGVVAQLPRRQYEKGVLFLTRQGFLVLSQEADISHYPKLDWTALEKRLQVSDLSLNHELAVVDVKTAFHRAARQLANYELVEFSTWPRLFAFPTTRRDPRTGRAGTLVKADAFLRIKDSNGGIFHFFLEVDRSNEVQKLLAHKALCYRDYYQSGGFALRLGNPADAYRLCPFRVLMIFLNAERRNNAAERLLQQSPPILKIVWLSTLTEVIANPFGAIWMRPADYQAATLGTSFNPQNQQSAIYRRQMEREELIDKSVQKLALLD